MNPYASPQSNQEDSPEVGNLVLATRGSRFLSALIDGILMSGLIWIVILFILDIKFQDVAKQGVMFNVKMALGGVAIFFVCNGFLLAKYGQTIGKLIMKIKIVTLEGRKPEFVPLILKRYLPVWIVVNIPIAGGIINLINVLFIFRDDRRCVHDLIAGTKVVSAT